MLNNFYKKQKNIKLSNILKLLKINNYKGKKNVVVSDIKDILSAKKNEITFFHNLKYNHFDF